MRRVSTLTVSRRNVTGGILLGMGGAFLLGCGSVSSTLEVPGAAGTGGSAGSTSGGGAGANTADSGGSANAWASGGTKSMTGSYADPFATPASTCVLLAAATEGPCTEAADQIRKDISEGYGGLPVRLALRVVDGACDPVAGATVKVWHTQVNGSYSGNTPNNGMCLKDQADSARHYFRGVQTTDANGRLDFDTCFPGWYRGRAIHIHYTVAQGGKTFTSQLVFDQALINEIFTTHPEYAPYGLPDTPNASDNVVGNANLASFTLDTKRMDDGTMLAYKQLVLA
jgi:protocatechuate 3,4-dioxygenase beta subunit